LRKYFHLVIIVLLCFSCDKDYAVSAGFEGALGAKGHGETRLSIEAPGQLIYMEGSVRTDSGENLVRFFNPEDSLVLEENFSGPDEQTIKEEYTSGIGEWFLRYSSIGGTGYINLHVHN